MMVKKMIWAGLFGLMLSVSNLWAADEVKIGIVDFKEVLELSKAGKKAQAEVKEKGQNMESELKQMGTEIKDLEKQLAKEKMVISEEAFEEKKREMRIKIYDLNTKQKQYLKDFNLMEARVIKEIHREVMQLVAQMGEEEGYSLILEKNESGVIYAPAAIDLTQKVIDKYDRQ